MEWKKLHFQDILNFFPNANICNVNTLISKDYREQRRNEKNFEEPWKREKNKEKAEKNSFL